MPCPSLTSVYTAMFGSPKQYAVSGSPKQYAVSVVTYINHEQCVHLLYRKSMIEFSTDRRGLEFRNWDYIMTIASLTRE